MLDKLEIKRKVKAEEFLLRIKREKKSKIRKKIQALKLVHQGLSARQAAEKVKLSPSSVERAVHRFNAEGWEGLEDKYMGRIPQMTPEEEDAFRDRILHGPTEADGVSVFHGKDAHRILRDEFDVKVHFRTTYKILDRIGLSYLVPRPRHPKSDPQKQRVFKKTSGVE